MSPVFLSGIKPRAGRTGFELLGDTYVPTMSDVVAAGFQAGLEGEGSAIQDVAASEVARELGREDELGAIQSFSGFLNNGIFGALDPENAPSVEESVPLSQEEWNASPYFRKNLSYQPGMTTRAAAILANVEDRTADRNFVLQKADGIAQGAGFLVGGFAGAMADAKNIAASTAVAVATPLVVGGLAAGGPVGGAAGAGAAGTVGLVTGAARFGTALSRLSSAGVATLRASRAARLGAVLGESVVATIPQAVSGVQNADIIQQEYDAQDAAFDLLASAGLGAGLQGAGEALSAAWRRRARVDDSIEVAQVAFQQVNNGEKIDVQPLVQSALADYVPDVSRVDFTPRFVQEGGSGKKVRFRAEQEVFGEVITSRVNNTKAGAEAELKEKFLARSVQVAAELGLPPEQMRQLEALTEVRGQLKTFDGMATAERLTELAPSVARAREKVAAAERLVETASPRKVESRKRGLEEARKELEAARATERPLMQQAAARERQKLEELAARGEDVIRDVQRKSAAKRLPEYARAQLDMSVEGRAARSIDPMASRIAAEETPDVRFDAEEPVASPPQPEIDALRNDPEFAAALAEIEAMDNIPVAVENFIKCRAGI